MRHLAKILMPLALTACTNTSATAPDLAMCTGPMGGPVSGAVDTHCTTDAGAAKQSTSQASCMYKPDGGGDSHADYGNTMNNSSGDDDDCKYHVAFTVDPICKGGSTTFKVVATRTVDGMPASGAAMVAEVFLGDTHPAPNTNTTTVEGPPGTYTIGPIDFDLSGKWTIRFHLYENCLDFANDSPHGHAAFFINVP